MKQMFVLVAILVLFGSPSAWAQVTADGTIRGVIKDDQGGVLPGATIVATSPTAPSTHQTVSDVQGSYRLIDLPPGEWKLVAELQGFAKFERTGIIVRAGLNIEVDIQMKVGTLSETIVVTGESPMLEVQKPGQAVNISGDTQRQLPLTSKRDWYNFLEVIPSVTNRSVDIAGGQVYMLRGSEIEGHVFQLDGMDMGSFRQSRADYIQFSTDAIQDIQVKTAGVDASAPIGVGVVVNMATQTGTNQFKGAVGTLYTSKNWNGNNADPGGTTSSNKLFQPDASLGGPILKKHVFFFGAFRYSRQTLGISRNSTQAARLQALQPGYKPFDNENRFKYQYFKVTGQLSSNHQVVGFVQNDLTPQDVNAAYNGTAFERTSYGGKALGARISSVWGTNLTTKVAASYNDKSLTRDWSVFEGHMNPGPSQQIYSSTVISGGQRSGSGLAAALNNTMTWTTSPTSKYTIQGDVTYYKPGWAGSHEFQTGFFLQPNSVNRNLVKYPNGGYAYEDSVLRDANNPAAGYIPFHRRVYEVEEQMTSSVRAQDYAVYVQDTYKPMSRLSITLGLRADYVATDDEIFDVTLQKGWNVGPRVGATYVLTEGGRSVLRGSYSIVHDMPQSTYISSAGTNLAGFVDHYDNNLDGVFEISLTTPKSTRLNTDREIDPDYHQPYIKEYVLGYGRQFPGQLSLEATFVRRDYMDRPALVEVNGIYDGNVFRGYKNETLNSIYLATNNTYNWFVYSGFELSAAKRAKKMQLIGGYTRGWQHIDGYWQPNDPALFIQPSAFPNDRGLGSWRGRGMNSFTADSRSPSWQKHVFRLGGSYSLPRDVTVASNVSFLSGPYSGPVVTNIATPDPQFGPSTVTLSNGRTVGNPLATTIRFAYATRGEGQIKTPNLVVWNMKVQKDFRFGAQKLQASLDIYNLTNNAADQQFLSGGEQLNGPNYALKDGKWQGTNRQAPRIGQLSIRFQF